MRNIRWACLLRFQLRSTARPQPKPARSWASGQDWTKRSLHSLAPHACRQQVWCPTVNQNPRRTEVKHHKVIKTRRKISENSINHIRQKGKEEGGKERLRAGEVGGQWEVVRRGTAVEETIFRWDETEEDLEQATGREGARTQEVRRLGGVTPSSSMLATYSTRLIP